MRPELADEALANLVRQFARPLDFLRELAQNAIDAGTPVVDVWVRWVPSEANTGVLEICVQDHGEGMDEPIIDEQLTSLFSSNKEDDLTKIGKFGIGFTSVFALEPEAVLVRTGRHGEYWELLFHADRSFDKVRLDQPVTGTSVTVFKRCAEAEARQTMQGCRDTLLYWCEHSDTPITFRDRTGEAQPTEAAASDDPFAAFAVPETKPRNNRIDRPLDLPGAAVQVMHQVGDMTVLVGLADGARYGFYAGGITLLSTNSSDALGAYAPRLQHLTFKVKCDRLEHTLTRDNVLQDVAWHSVMAALVKATGPLREAVLQATTQAVAEGVPLGPWHRRLAACAAVDDRAFVLDHHRLPLFRTLEGKATALRELLDNPLGTVLMAERATPLTEGVRAAGLTVIRDDPSTRRLLDLCVEPPLFDLAIFRRTLPLRRVEDVFVLPEVLVDDQLDPGDRRLLDAVRALFADAIGARLTVKLGEFGGADLGHEDVLALNGPTQSTVFLRPATRRFVLPAFLRWRTLLVNRNHTAFRLHRVAAEHDPELGALGLATALLHVEDIEGERVFRRLYGQAAERWYP
jgi:hypothetical protein